MKRGLQNWVHQIWRQLTKHTLNIFAEMDFLLTLLLYISWNVFVGRYDLSVKRIFHGNIWMTRTTRKKQQCGWENIVTYSLVINIYCCGGNRIGVHCLHISLKKGRLFAFSNSLWKEKFIRKANSKHTHTKTFKTHFFPLEESFLMWFHFF